MAEHSVILHEGAWLAVIKGLNDTADKLRKNLEFPELKETSEFLIGNLEGIRDEIKSQLKKSGMKYRGFEGNKNCYCV